MRLVRLTTTNENAEFRNSFATDIKITPYSKIALKSLALDTTIGDIEITSANDLIDFQVTASQGQLQAQLNHATYNSANHPALFKDMNQKMNNQLNPAVEGSNIGLEIQNKVATNGRFEMSMNRGNLSDYRGTTHQELAKGTIPVQYVTTFQGTYKANGTPTGNNCYMYYNKLTARGGGCLRFKNALVSTGVKNYIMGFSKTNPDTFASASYPDAKIDYAIQVGDLTTDPNYITWVNGATKTALASVPVTQGLPAGDTTNDFVVMEINQGKVEGRIYRNGQPASELILQESYEYPSGNNDVGQDLYAFIIFNGNASQTQVRNLRTTLSPFHVTPTSQRTEDTSEGLSVAPPNITNPATAHFLEYEGQSLADFLGFNNERIPQTGSTPSTGKFIARADSIFRPTNKSDCYVVQLLNIGVSSYDGYSLGGTGDGERKSYLAVIPESNDSGGVNYNEAYPIFIDLDNAEPLTLRNINCRVLLNDLSPVQMSGLGTITLLIEDGEKREINNFQ